MNVEERLALRQAGTEEVHMVPPTLLGRTLSGASTLPFSRATVRYVADPLPVKNSDCRRFRGVRHVAPAILRDTEVLSPGYRSVIWDTEVPLGYQSTAWDAEVPLGYRSASGIPKFLWGTEFYLGYRSTFVALVRAFCPRFQVSTLEGLKSVLSFKGLWSSRPTKVPRFALCSLLRHTKVPRFLLPGVRMFRCVGPKDNGISRIRAIAVTKFRAHWPAGMMGGRDAFGVRD